MRALLGSLAIALVLAGACSTSKDESAWLVTGEIEHSADTRSCSNIEGVTDALFSTISDSERPEGLKFEVVGEDAAQAVVGCVEDVGGTATARRA